MKRDLLIIDDDADLNALLVEYLDPFGFHLRTATTASAGLEAFGQQVPELIILDIMLPDANGLSVCQQIRADRRVPIIMLSARGEAPDRILGLELGADDYLSKPFEPRELVARIESVLRRAQEANLSSSYRSEGLLLDVDQRRVTLNQSEVNLTTTEFELLHALMAARGRVLSRDKLLEQLRGIETEAYDRSIDMAVSRLRDKLGDDSRAPRFIKTVRLTGYQFIGAVGT